MRAIFESMTCRRCGKVWSLPLVARGTPEEREAAALTIQAHKEKCRG